MTISSQVRTAGPFTGNGVAVGGPFYFKVFAADQLTGTEMDTEGNERTLAYGIDFSVTLNADQNAAPGGTIAYLVAGTPTTIPVGYVLNFTSALENLQPLALTNNGGFFPKTINDAFDRVVILIQQLVRGMNASIKFPLSDGTGISSELPSKSLRLGKILAFDPVTGGPVVSSHTLADIEAGADAADTAADDAAASAAAAAASAAAAAGSVAALAGTSSTSVTSGTGPKSFVTQAGKQFANAQLLISSISDPTIFMHGNTTTYAGTNLDVNVTDIGPTAGTKNDWAITVSGTRGPIGLPGTPGAGTGDMLAANNLSELTATQATARSNIGAAKNGANTDLTSMQGLTTYIAISQCFRLSLSSGVPVPTTDVVGAGTLYLTPYKGNVIHLHDGTKWNGYNSAQVSLALSGLTPGLPYDVFAYWNGVAVTLELLAWTNTTTRATALAYQQGVLIKSGAQSRRYLGTILPTGAATCEDSVANRYVWNYYNRRSRLMQRFETTPSWNYTTATVRQANGNVANQLNFIIGVVEDTVFAKVNERALNSSIGATLENSIGLNSITVPTAGSSNNITTALAGGYVNPFASLEVLPALGKNYLAWLEYSTAVGITTWEGQSVFGIQGKVMA